MDKIHTALLIPVLLLSILLVSCSDNSTNDNTELTIDDDLNVTYIQRLPEMDYVWNSSNPAREGWPAEGQEVTWRAYVMNWNNQSYKDVEYQWKIDGNVVESGTMDFPASEKSALSLNWSWEFTRHELTFQIDPEDKISEFTDSNNQLMVYTDAISAGLYVEKRYYDFFHENQYRLTGLGSNSFEDYAQRSFQTLNELFAESTFPEAPQGVHDRIRIDQITIVDDGALPLDKSVLNDNSFDPIQAKPNINDRSVDLQWGFPATRLGSFGETSELGTRANYNFFYVDGFMLHEVMHARYLLDNYGVDVYHGTNNSWVDIRKDDELVAGSFYLPGETTTTNGVKGLKIYESKYQGLMSGVTNYSLSIYSVLALNNIAGERATLGNYNHPENIGVFLNFLPENNHVRLVNKDDGTPLSNADIEIYRSTLPPDQYIIDEDFRNYDKYFDNTPDLSFSANGEGIVNLGRNPFAEDKIVMAEIGATPGTPYYSNATLILRVENDTHIGYTFIEALKFNLEYLKGNIQDANYEIAIPMLEK